MESTISDLSSSQLLQVPSEIRCRVYDFLFGDATFIISNTTEFKQLLAKPRAGIVTEDDEKEIKENSCNAFNFPIVCTATCRFFQTEIDQYLVLFLSAFLVIAPVEGDPVCLSDFIPSKYLALVSRIQTSYDTAAGHSMLLGGHKFPNLFKVDIETFHGMEYDEDFIDALFTRSTKSKNSDASSRCLSSIFNMENNLFQQYQAGNIDVKI
jgi:hypothetical protein